MLNRLTLAQKALILVGFPLVFEIGFVMVLTKLLMDTEQEAAREAHSREVFALCGQFAKQVFTAGKSRQNFRSAELKVIVPELRKQLDVVQSAHDELAALVKGHPREEAIVSRINNNIQDARGIVDLAGKDFDQGVPPLQIMLKRRQELQNRMDSTAELMFELAQTAKAVGAESPKIQAAYRRRVIVVLFGGLVLNTVLAIALCIHFNRTTVARLQTVMDNTYRLARNDRLNPPLEGSDEIAKLDSVFNDMAAALKAADERRAQLERMKEEFLSMVSHDLRTPLTSVRAALSILQTGMHGQLNEDGVETLEDAEVNVDRLIKLINDLLDMEKLELGKLKLDVEPVCADSIFAASISAVASYAKQQQISLERECPPDLLIAVDRDRMVQVIVNLLSNAIKFTPAGGQVLLSAGAVAERVRLEVRDSGRGISPELCEKIFDRFEQAQDSDARRGSGLGLSICKAIVEAHGGVIGVTSKIDEGSCFWIELGSPAHSVDLRTGEHLPQSIDSREERSLRERAAVRHNAN